MSCLFGNNRHSNTGIASRWNAPPDAATCERMPDPEDPAAAITQAVDRPQCRHERKGKPETHHQASQQRPPPGRSRRTRYAINTKQMPNRASIDYAEKLG